MTAATVNTDWEFHAPQFFDFANPEEYENDEADAWFDVQETTGNIDDESGFCDESHREGQENQSKRGEKRQRTTESVSSIPEESPSAKRRRGTPHTRSTSVKKAVRRAVPSTGKRATPVVRRPLRPNNLPTGKPPMTINKSAASRVKVPTIPVTPAFMRRKQMKTTTAKTTEQIEMAKIEESRRQAEQQRILAKKSYEQLNTAKGHMPAYSAKPLTKPDEFNFHTDTRVKSHAMETRNDIKSQDFTSMLRKPDVATTYQTKGPTVPKPFSLHDNRPAEQGYKFVSDAQKLIAFQKNTPDRFHTRARNKAATPRRHSPRLNKLTVARTPNLETRCRKRNIHIVSQAEMEEKEVDDIKRFKFRAKPVNKKVLDQPETLPEVTVKEPTVPQPFNLHAERSHEQKSVDEERYEFHAQPVPKNILGGVVGVKPAKEIQCTVPESPAFALKNRVRSIMDKTKVQEEPDQITVKANPVPHYGLAFQPKLNHRKTVPQPFSFEVRDKDKIHAKEEKIKHVLEEEKKMHVFHANPLPSSSPDDLPEKKVKPNTNPKPFNLESEVRGAYKTGEWTRKMEDEIKHQRHQASSFKARPNRVTCMKPFEPKKSERSALGKDESISEVCEIELNTDRRAAERRDFERRKREKKQELDAVLDEVRKRKDTEEQEEIARLRAEAVHKSKPIRHYKPVVIHGSEKTLTTPMSPRFSERLAFNKKQ
ncbi:targeting protein for Xklp2 homolog [Tubulanus polymorphus]|uniref:targeting protein for Xklp2 homolog n=1 Tax=Tubulanus polymorphus TaxID=672921 RepID=UPI003DA3162B